MSRKAIEGVQTLSAVQQGMLYETIRAPESGIHIEQSLFVIDGELNTVAFEQAWQEVINLHAVLRTGFIWKDQPEPLQVVLREVPLPLVRQDWCAFSSIQQQEQLEAYLRDDRHRGFVLAQAPLMRLALFQLAAARYQLVWTSHHILMDGWCHKLVLRDVLTCYEALSQGRATQLAPRRPYKDYLVWLKQQDISQAEYFWRRSLHGFVRPTLLGREQEPTPQAAQEEGIGTLKDRLPATLTTRLQAVARRHHLTLNILLQGAWALLLSRYDGSEDVVFGITVAGRPAELADVETMVGLFMNTLPLRVQVPPERGVWSWLEDLQAENLELRQYEYSPAGAIHRWSELPGRLPLFESVLVVENYPMELTRSQERQVKISLSEMEGRGAQTNYALTFLVTLGTQLGIKCIYHRARFTSAAVAQILRHLLAVLEYLATDPEGGLAAIYELLPTEQIPLVSPAGRELLTQANYQAPRTPVEEIVAALWSELLGREPIGREENFFAQGGHSLLATQVIARIRTMLQIELPLRSLFEAPTIAGLAQRVQLALHGGQARERPALQPVAREGGLPLSFAQQRLWFLAQLEPGNAAYNIAEAVRLRGSLNKRALAESLAAMCQRHESLRTRFHLQGDQPVQEIVALDGFVLPCVDLSGLADDGGEQHLRQLARQEARRPFDLSGESLLRVKLVVLGDQEQVLLVTMHHIISDGWSMGIFVREVTTFYEAFRTGQDAPLPALAIQYGDFAQWQRSWLQGEALEEQMRYWQKQLADLAPLDLPVDYARPAVQRYHGTHQNLLLPSSLLMQLKRLSQQEGVTLFMTLVAAFQTLLSRYSGQRDLAIGTDIANRTHAEIEGLIGFFANTLVLRADLAGNPSFLDLLQRVREVCLGAYAHQDVPFEKLVEVLQPERDLSRSPLFQVFLTLQQASRPAPTPALHGLTLSRLTADTATAKFDLSLALSETERGLACVMEYNTDLFAPATISQMLLHFQTLLEAVVRRPQQRLLDLSLLSEEQRHHLLASSHGPTRPFSSSLNLCRRLELRAAYYPERVALLYHEQQMTYGELNRRVTRLALLLRERGVGTEMLVGLYLPRTPELLVSILAIFKAGGAYVPLDPAYPSERLTGVLEEAQLAVLLTTRSLRESVPANLRAPLLCLEDCELTTSSRRNEEENSLAQRSLAAARTSTGEELAYVIYTSGSTGRPKGAMVQQVGMLNHLLAKIEALQLSEHDIVLQTASHCFDISVWQFLASLLVGGRVHILSDEQAHDPIQVWQQVVTGGGSILEMVPSLLHHLLESLAGGERGENEPLGLRWLLVTGEPVSVRLCQRWLEGFPAIPVLNAYGPTECSDDVTHACIDQAPSSGQRGIPIGSPVDNLQVYILDEQLGPVPVGVVGQIYVGGIGVGRGYLQDPERTASIFIPDPHSQHGGGRLYRTGDLGRLQVDGQIQFLGRLDEQVKVRGFRIELGEIKAVLQGHEQVGACEVLEWEVSPEDVRLVAYVVGREQKVPSWAELRSYLKGKLPEYMVPSFFVALEALPVTANGKLDRRALPEPQEQEEVSVEGPEETQNPVEGVVTTIWKEVLGREQVDREGNFFTQGGHSLLATQVLARLRATLQVELSLRTLFEAPTIVAVSAQVEGALRQQQGVQIPPVLPVSRAQKLPLSFAQQRLWFLDRLQPTNAAYNIANAVRLHGRLDTRVLERCLTEISYRHESLRTTFHVENNQPEQIINAANALALPVVDLGALCLEAREEQARRQMNKEAQQPFDLVNGPVWRAVLLRLSEEEHILLLTMHHIVADAWSLGVFVREVSVLYENFSQGRPSPLAPLPVQYADFAAWQRNWLQGEVLNNYIDYWRKQLRGAVPLELPCDHPRPRVRSYRGANYAFALPRDLSQRLLALSHQEAATLFITLLAAFQALMYRCTDQTDITVGTDIANRNSIEAEGLIGFFINLLALRTHVSGTATFRELLHQVRSMVLGAYTHQDIPFDMLVEHLRLDRKTNQTPLVQVLFVLQNVPRSQRELPGLELSSLEAETTTAKFDVALFMREGADGLRGTVNYSTDLFAVETIVTMMKRFEAVLQSIVAQPDAPIDALNIDTEEERLKRNYAIKEKSMVIRAKIKQTKGKMMESL